MKQPVKKIRAGSGVSCALWENEITVNGKPVTILKASVERSYKDKNDKWKSSSSFSERELPHAIWCLQRAFDAMIEERPNNGNEQA